MLLEFFGPYHKSVIDLFIILGRSTNSIQMSDPVGRYTDISNNTHLVHTPFSWLASLHIIIPGE